MTDLGPSPSGRWSPTRKASLAQAILDCKLTQDQACERFGLSPDELGAWVVDYYEGGRGALTGRARQERRRAA